MIYFTGDCHGDYTRFLYKNFPQQETMTLDDYVIVLGDFGYWNPKNREEQLKFDSLSYKNFTILFIDGNHENFDALYNLPVEKWKGGKIHKIRDNIFHLMRGQIFNIDGYKIFIMGGAASHDIDDGVIDINDPNFERIYSLMSRLNKTFRVKHLSWWEEEMPSEAEYTEARKNLAKHNYEVDFILSHCAPSNILDMISGGLYNHDKLTDFLQEIEEMTKFTCNLFGHYHENSEIGTKHIMLYENIIPITICGRRFI